MRAARNPVASPIAALIQMAPRTTGQPRLGRSARTRRRPRREEHQAGTVVEEALAVDDGGQRGRDGEPLERRHDRGRIGRGDHRADDEGEIQAETGREVEHDGDDRRGDQDTRDRQERQPADPTAELDDAEPIAASKTRPGSSTSRTSRARRRAAGSPPRWRRSPTRSPATTSATVYGSRSGRATMATSAASPSSPTSSSIASGIAASSIT